MIFYLGTHQPAWLRRLDVPLFVSRRTLHGIRRLYRGTAPWALDSGAFTELKQYGRWTITARQYVSEVRHYAAMIGGLHWAAQQDWMCEPAVIAGGRWGKETFVGTGLSVAEHQVRTVANLLELRSQAPDVAWVPVLQGWEPDDYLRHRDAFGSAGVDLDREALVGLGSVCRRQHTEEVERLIRRLHGEGLRLHGFGFKLQGLARCAPYLASSDSLAWSYAARRQKPLPGCVGHINCANCPRYALQWRQQVLRVIEQAESVPTGMLPFPEVNNARTPA